ncbi:hypothetical protein PIB30_074183 [Stylosanthes scabra]|uniref:Reverse transcriptase zinc-binding domain-containing protein n=1 Tax=Stylosanthes scabra TaxID=79078 RepID=A0ABU6SQI5_9FABA|nr:hypothetical protein [Stylosanthes scabra]
MDPFSARSAFDMYITAVFFFFLVVFYDKHNNDRSSESEDIRNCSRLIWQSIVPPKVELLLWMIMLEKLNMRDKLVRCRILPSSMVTCPLCLEEPEKRYC